MLPFVQIRQRRLYTQPKHWSAGARTHKNVVYDHLVNMAVQKRDDKLNQWRKWVTRKGGATIGQDHKRFSAWCIDLGPTLIVSWYIAKLGFFWFVHFLYQLDFRVKYRSYTWISLSEEIYYLSMWKIIYFSLASLV